MAVATFAGPVWKPYMLTGVQVTEKQLGRGSYGMVLNLKYRGLKCAGKKLYPVLYEQGVGEIVRRFEGECQLLAQMRHPNIVQFIGVYFEEGCHVPILVMELLQTDLAECIDRYGVLPEEICFSILHDVALGLYHLHSQIPPIIHRDLSASNISLTSNMQAKISDLGVAKILNLTPQTTFDLTQAPGTFAYMPPEAMIPDPKYDTGIDTFSYGVLMIHALSGRRPFPSEAVYVDSNSGSLIPRSEAERRQAYLNDIGSTHHLMDLILRCVSNNPALRPIAAEIVERMDNVTRQFPPTLYNRVEMLQQIRTNAIEKETLRGENERLAAVAEQYRAEVEQDIVSASSCLRGVDAIAETSILVGNKATSYEWKGYGIKLHIPEGAIPDPQILHIVASFTGQFEFPEAMQLVSAVYWIRCPGKFAKPATIEIQHCATSQYASQCHNITAKCTEEILPYTFKILEGGHFLQSKDYNPSTAYGNIPVRHFSAFACGLFPRRSEARRQYWGQVFYIPKGSNHWLLHIVIIWDLDICKTVLSKKYAEHIVEDGPYQLVTFNKKEIELDVTKPEIISGWSLVPLVHPKITREEIDSYSQRKPLPTYQFELHWSKSGSPTTKFERKIVLDGVEGPQNFFWIIRSPMSPGTTAQPLSATSALLAGGEDASRLDARPTPRQLQYLQEQEGISVRVMETVAPSWEQLALALGFDGCVLEAIQRDVHDRAISACRKILLKWLDGGGLKPVNWHTLTKALIEAGYPDLAKDVRKQLNRIQ